MELLLFHDLAVSPCGKIFPGCEASSSSSTESLAPDGDGSKAATKRVPISVFEQQKMLTSASFPRLTKLLRARGNHNYSNVAKLLQSKSVATLDDGSNGVVRTRARARPRSAGAIASRPSSPGVAHAFGVYQATSAGDMATHFRRDDPSQKRPVQPVIAPGKHFLGEAEGFGGLDGGKPAVETVVAGGPSGKEAMVKWTMQDILTRNASSLSRNDLLSSVGRLRRRAGGNGYDQEDCTDEVRAIVYQY